MKKVLKITFVSITALILLAGATGLIYQSYMQARDAETYPPPGQLYDVAGVNTHMICEGQGEPWLMMEGGLMSDITSWALVWDGLTALTRVCAYDRPGMGWSEDIKGQRDGYQVAAALNQLIKEGGPDGPFVILGMSAGGVYVRDYYNHYPERVAGMVLVDSSHEQQRNRFPKELMELDTLDSQLQICKLIAPFGVMRFLGVWEEILAQLAPEVDVELDPSLSVALYNRTGQCAALEREMASFTGDTTRTEPPAKMADLPLLVLSQGKPIVKDDLPPTMSYELALRQRALWNEMQTELTELSTQGRRVVAKNSGHIIQLAQPELMVQEISRLLEEIRSE